MLADGRHRACLRPFLAFALMHGEAHFVALSELVEPAGADGIAMKIDFAAVSGRDEAEAVVADEAGDAAMTRGLVHLDVAAGTPDVILELAPHGIEAIADGDIDILMGVVLRR